MRLKRFRTFLFALAVASGTCEASTIVFDNITGNTQLNTSLVVGYDPTLNSSEVSGLEFYASITGYISQLEIALQSTQGTPPYQVGIYTNGSGAPGSLVETLGFYLSPGSTTYGYFSSGATLNAGQEYWLVAGVGNSVTPAQWWAYTGPNYSSLLACHGSTSGRTGTLASCGGGNSYAASEGLQIAMSASPVPLPAAACLLLSGLGGLGAFARRRLRA